MAQNDERIDELTQQVRGLEEQVGLDHQLIAGLESQGMIDRNQIGNLEAALITCRRIGTAIGIVMVTYKITDDDAFRLLSVGSQRSHRKLRDIADEVVLTGTLPEG